MTRKSKCSNCGKWYYNDNGLMISRPPEYDQSMCGDCNRKIDNEIKDEEFEYKYRLAAKAF